MLFIVVGILALVGSASAANTGKTTAVSTTENGTPGNAGGSLIINGAVSDDGRYVAFLSGSTNLVPNDNNGVNDIFVKDTKTGKVVLASVATNGTQTTVTSSNPKISGDGRFVLFTSLDSNLVADDTNGMTDVFMRDLLNNITTRVNVATDGTEANDNAYMPSISQTGRYVVFYTKATNLDAGATDGRFYAYRRDTVTNITDLVGLSGTMQPVAAYPSSVSADGRYVAFWVQAGVTLVPEDTNNANDNYICDMVNHTYRLVAVALNGTIANGLSTAVSITPDGRYVIFHSTATNLVPGEDTNNQADLFVRDLLTGVVTRVNDATNGTQMAGGALMTNHISNDGRFVVFAVQAGVNNLVPNDTNNLQDVFVHDLLTGVTIRVSVATDGTQANGSSLYPSISGNGRYVIFSSGAGNLVPDVTGGVYMVDLWETSVYPGDDLASVIENTEPGRIITIYGNNGTAFTYSGNLVIDKPLTINGLGVVVIKADDPSKPVIKFTGNATGSVVSGLTIIGSNISYGALLENVDNITVTDSIVAGSIGFKFVNSTNNTLTGNSVISMDYVPPVVGVDVGTGSYNTSKTVTLSTEANGIIYYTLDGSTPDSNSTVYTGPITIDATTTLKYLAVDEAGNPSQVYEQIYTIDKVAPTAAVNVNGGLYNSDKTVTLTVSENGIIYYTTNGSTPSTSSTRYTGPITLTKTTTLKFLAVDVAGNLSPVYSQLYTIDKVKPTATASVKAGLYKATQKVTLKVSEAGSIYYTIDGKTPTAASKKSTGPISISKTTTLKYLAIDAAGNKSPVYTAKYTIDKVVPKVSSASPKNGATNVKRSSALTVKFSEVIKNSTNWSKIYVKDVKTGKKISITKSIKGNVLTIKTTKKTASTQYQVYIPNGAVKDAAGNNLAKAYTYKIKTGTT